MAEFEWQGMRILRMPNRPGSHVRHPEGPEDLAAGIWGLSECDGGVYYCSLESEEDSVMRLEPTPEFAKRLSHGTFSIAGARVVFAFTGSEVLEVLLFDRRFCGRDMKALASMGVRLVWPAGFLTSKLWVIDGQLYQVRQVDLDPARSARHALAWAGALYGSATLSDWSLTSLDR